MDRTLGAPTAYESGCNACLIKPAALIPKGFTSIYAGAYSTCAMRDDRLYCWGLLAGLYSEERNEYDPVVADKDPEFGRVEGSFRTVSLGPHNACAIGTDGALFCMGIHRDGQLGIGDVAPDACAPHGYCAREFVRVGTRSDWSAVSVGETHICGIAGGQAYCWGSDSLGQLGLGSTARDRCVQWNDDYAPCAREPQPVGLRGEWTAIAAGEEHSCGVRGGLVYCWGDTAYDLGLFSDGRPTPERIYVE